MKCKICISWKQMSGKFGTCEAINIHDGEQSDMEENENLPPEETDMIINTSEWFQNFLTNKNFGCTKYKENEK